MMNANEEMAKTEEKTDKEKVARWRVIDTVVKLTVVIFILHDILFSALSGINKWLAKAVTSDLLNVEYLLENAHSFEAASHTFTILWMGTFIISLLITLRLLSLEND